MECRRPRIIYTHIHTHRFTSFTFPSGALHSFEPSVWYYFFYGEVVATTNSSTDWLVTQNTRYQDNFILHLFFILSKVVRGHTPRRYIIYFYNSLLLINICICNIIIEFVILYVVDACILIAQDNHRNMGVQYLIAMTSQWQSTSSLHCRRAFKQYISQVYST